MNYVIAISAAVISSAVAFMLIRLNSDAWNWKEEPEVLESSGPEPIEVVDSAKSAAPAGEENAPMTEQTDALGQDSAEDGAELSKLSQRKLMRYAGLMLAVNIFTAVYICIMQEWNTFAVLRAFVALAVLWACAWTDSHTFTIPNRILLLGVALWAVLLSAELFLNPAAWRFYILNSLIGASAMLIGTLICRLISREAIGYGDVKLLTVLGLLLRSDGIWNTVLLTMIAAFAYSLFLLLFKNANRKTEIPFAPIVLIGNLLSIYLTIM